MRKLQVKDVLTRIKEPIELEDDVLYKRVTIKTKHQGVFLRDSEYGKDIGTKKQFFIKKGQFLLSKIDARNGAFGIVPDEVDGAIITGNFWTYKVNEEELNIELFYIMTSLPFFDELCKNASSGSTNRQYLDEKKFLNQEITLPPIEEQNSFIEHFKKLQEKHSQTLEELQTQSELIIKLRSSILSDAVSGKLVPQDSNDESAEILLEKIKAEKEKLIKEEKIKKQKPLPPINEDEIPYKLPDGWVWCRLNELADVGTGATPLKSQVSYYKNGTIPWITSSSTGTSIINHAETFITEKALSETNCKMYPKETLILAMYGQGKTRGQISELNIDATINQACAAIVLYRFEKYMKQYLKLFFQKYYLEIRELAAGGAQPNLNLQKVKSTPIPLPPLEEQKRIVEKVEKLMATCDALELEVQNSKTETEKLMQSVLKEAFL
jgi:type I restriction enzyme S subunit